jgi:hypothetical protein
LVDTREHDCHDDADVISSSIHLTCMCSTCACSVSLLHHAPTGTTVAVALEQETSVKRAHQKIVLVSLCSVELLVGAGHLLLLLLQ